MLRAFKSCHLTILGDTITRRRSAGSSISRVVGAPWVTPTNRKFELAADQVAQKAVENDDPPPSKPALYQLEIEQSRSP